MVTAEDLKKCKVFRVLSEDKMRRLTQIAEMRTYKKTDHVYEAGDEATHLFMVDQGLVGMRKFGFNDRVGISFEVHSGGDLFGAASFMSLGKYTLTAVCLVDCRILAVDAGELSAMCEKAPEMGFKLMKRVARIYFNRYRDVSSNLYGVVRSLQAMMPFAHTTVG